MPVPVDSPLGAYFTAIDAGEYETLLGLFSDDATFIPGTPPPSAQSPQLGRLQVIQGRAAIKGYFDRRGVVGLRHHLRASVTEGKHCFVDGVVTVPDVPDVPGMIFMSHGVFDAEGQIIWYAAIPAVITAEQAQRIEASRTA